MTPNEPKTYGLSEQETSLLVFVRNHMDAIFSGIISTIAGTRLGYSVTPNTQFNLSGDLKNITIMELGTPEQAPVAQPAAPAEAPADASPVVTAPEPTAVEGDQLALVQTGELVEPNATAEAPTTGEQALPPQEPVTEPAEVTQG